MSRNLEASEVETFSKIHHVEPRCSVCGSSDITVRIYEGYGSPAKAVGGDLANGSLVAAIVICNACGHGDTLNCGRLANGLAVAS